MTTLALIWLACSGGIAEYEGDEAGECSDAADNDRDGLFDCDDDGCDGSPDCEDYDPSAPSAPVVAITPGEPTPWDDLVCAVVEESVDPEGDVVTYSFRWLVDDSNAGIYEETVTKDLTADGETWTCEVTPFDGEHEGPPGIAAVDVVDPYQDAVTDLLLVLDDSPSMVDEAGALLVHLDLLLAAFEGRGSRAGVVTVDVQGRAGALVAPWTDLTRDDALADLRAAIACNAVCWDPAEVRSDPNYDSTDPLSGVTKEWLDDVCGNAAWEEGCGSGEEEGLEALLDALCRAASDPPDACFETPSVLTEADAGSSEGIPREGTVLLALIISDEGDGSRRLGTGESDPEVYQQLYAEFDLDLRIAVIGPPYENGSLPCNSGGAHTWGTERYQVITEESGFTYQGIAGEDETGNCEERVEEALTELAAEI